MSSYCPFGKQYEESKPAPNDEQNGKNGKAPEPQPAAFSRVMTHRVQAVVV
ncbi:MAG TPA: hypothetical protein VJ723_08390 [Candidatus Angelobacter sp.]|nr:hypothetical protein [Candidatus Angelobacter sp.]